MRWRLGGIEEATIGLRSCRGRYVGFFHVVRSQNMKYALAGCQQVVGDDSSVTAPPQGFRAHDCAVAFVSELAQKRETLKELVAKGVVSIIVKTRIFPERVELGRHLARSAAQTSERRDVLVSDFEPRKRSG